MARILVVDDDEQLCDILQLTLKNAGHDVMQASNGNMADKLLAENTFDLVITDLIMPGKEGLELIMDLNKNFPELKLIAITGAGEKIDQRRHLRSAAMFGADDMLHKPFKNAILLKSVDDCLSGKTKGTRRGGGYAC